MAKRKRKRLASQTTKARPAQREPIIDREMVSEHLNVILEAVLGLVAAVAFVVALSSFGNFLDILEKSKVLHKGPIYDVIKWTVEVVGTATGVFGFLAFQWRLIRRTYTRLRKG